MPPRKRSSMGKLAKETAKKTDEILRDEELHLLSTTTIDWKALRPQVTDQKTFDMLIKEVEESTKKNENMALLHQRIKRLGKEGFRVVKKVISLLP